MKRRLHHILLAASTFVLSTFAPGASAQVISGTPEDDTNMQQVITSLNNRLNDAESTAFRLQQKETWRRIFRRGGHFNLSLGHSTVSSPDLPHAISGKNFAAAIQSGRSFYLHRTPIGGMAKIGLDWDWIDLGLSNNTAEIPSSPLPNIVINDPEYPLNLPLRQDVTQVRVGMGAGLSLHIAPFARIDRACRYLRFYAYFHVVPSLNALGIDYIDNDSQSVCDDEFDYRFVPFYSAGGGFAWKVISLGYEATWGSTRYDLGNALSLPDENVQLRSTSSRLVLSFRF